MSDPTPQRDRDQPPSGATPRPVDLAREIAAEVVRRQQHGDPARPLENLVYHVVADRLRSLLAQQENAAILASGPPPSAAPTTQTPQPLRQMLADAFEAGHFAWPTNDLLTREKIRENAIDKILKAAPPSAGVTPPPIDLALHWLETLALESERGHLSALPEQLRSIAALVRESAGVTPRVLELIQQRIAEDDGGPNAEYCWYCHADVNGKHSAQEPHASDCWRVLIEAAVRESVASVPVEQTKQE